jgi:hypothetical protein
MVMDQRTVDGIFETDVLVLIRSGPEELPFLDTRILMQCRKIRGKEMVDGRL